MSLQLFEIVPDPADRAGARAAVSQATKTIEAAGAEVVESQVTSDHGRVYVVAEAPTPAIVEALRREVTAGQLAGAARDVTGPDEVRLVGADREALSKDPHQAGYLVEWDLPDDLDMDSYLARKKAAAPGYAKVPEVKFLRTYVREDMDKCLCLYNSPDAQCVRAAREAVNTPIDRLHSLDHDGTGE